MSIEIATPSIQSLFIAMSFQAQDLASGTGVVCIGKSGRPVLITNWHNVTGLDFNTRAPMSPTAGLPDRLLIHHNKAGVLGRDWIVKEELLRDDGKPRWIDHPTYGDKVDFVALPLTNLTDVEICPHERHEDRHRSC